MAATRTDTVVLVFIASTEETEATLAKFDGYREALSKATSALVVGAGPAGVEYAGFLKSNFPSVHVILAHSGPAVLSGVPQVAPALQADVHAKLVAAGVEIVLNERVALPDGATDADLGVARSRTLRGSSGREYKTDVQLFLTGLTGFNTAAVAGLGMDLGKGAGDIPVNAYLQVDGHPTLFAAGDVAATGALKLAMYAGNQAAVVASNLRALLAAAADPGKAKLTAYHAPTVTMTVLSLSQTTGAAQGIPFDQWSLTGWVGNLLGRLKGGDFFVGRYSGLLKVRV
jgi:apoptosis-inducing factor 2